MGSALKPLSGGPLTVPFTQSGSERLTLDLAYWDAQGRVVAASEGLPLRPAKVRLVRLDPVDGFLKGLEERAAVFTETVSWSLPPLPDLTSFSVHLRHLGFKKRRETRNRNNRKS